MAKNGSESTKATPPAKVEPNPLDMPAPYPTNTDMANRLANAGLS